MLGPSTGTAERFSELTSPTFDDDDGREAELRALARADADGFRQVALALSLRDDDALRTLMDAIRSDGDWRVRAHTCAHVIGAAAVERLGSALEHAQQDHDRRVRLAAAHALNEGGRSVGVGIADRFVGMFGAAPGKDLVADDEASERGSG